MLPIYLLYDSGIKNPEAYDWVSEEEKVVYEAIIDTMEEIMNLLPGCRVVDYGTLGSSTIDGYLNDCLVRTARKDGIAELVDVDKMIYHLKTYPWCSEKHIEIVFISREILSESDDKRYHGMTEGNISIQSVYWYQNGILTGDAMRLAIKGLIYHELGHVFGLASDLFRANTVLNDGLHCTNYGCAMEQGLSVIERAKRAGMVGGVHYCPQCLNDLTRYISSHSSY